MSARKKVPDIHRHPKGKWITLAIMVLCTCFIWVNPDLINTFAAESNVQPVENLNEESDEDPVEATEALPVDDDSPTISNFNSGEQPSSFKVAILEIGEYSDSMTMKPIVLKSFEELRATIHNEIENIDAVRENQNVGGIQKVEQYNVQISSKNSTDTLIEGIDWALDNQVKLLQLPALEKEYSSEQAEAIQQASRSGLILVQETGVATLIDPGNDNSIIRTIRNFDTEATILETYNHSIVLNKPGQLDNLVADPSKSEIKLVSPENIKTIDTVLFLLDLDPSLTGEQIQNILTVSATPIGLIGDEYYLVDVARATELVLLQNERKLDQAVQQDTILNTSENRKGIVTTSSASPSITAPTVTSTSITWNVSYLVPNAWGNRLELYNATTHQWTDISGTYYTQNGNYTVNNLTPGNTYLGRLTYYQNGWIVVDLWRTTTALYAPSFQLSGITDTSVTLHATFPADAVYGNRVFVYEFGTNQWVYMTPDDYTPNGVYTFNGLKPSYNYAARLVWYNNGWNHIEPHFTATLQRKFEYDAIGRLKYVKDHMSNLLATYHYDSNGNLKSIEKH